MSDNTQQTKTQQLLVSFDSPVTVGHYAISLPRNVQHDRSFTMSSEKSHSVSVLALLPLRLSIGLSFLVSGQAKVAAGNWGAGYEPSLREFVVANLENAFSFYRPILESVVLNHSGKFAVLVAWGELMVGFSIFLGLFTRFGAAVGIFLMINFMFAKGMHVWVPGLDSVYLWALVTIFLCSPGRAFGLDQILRSRKRIRLFT